MRIKNAHKIKDSKLRAEPTAEEIWFYRYGDKCDPDALRAVEALHNALAFKVYPPPSRIDKCISDQQRDIFWEYVASNYEANWTKHDGHFFRKLADAMAVMEISNDPPWSCGISLIKDRQLRGGRMFTVKELHDELTSMEISTTTKTVGRIFAWLRVKPSPGKRGAPLGKPQKLVHSTRR